MGKSPSRLLDRAAQLAPRFDHRLTVISFLFRGRQEKLATVAGAHRTKDDGWHVPERSTWLSRPTFASISLDEIIYSAEVRRLTATNAVRRHAPRDFKMYKIASPRRCHVHPFVSHSPGSPNSSQIGRSTAYNRPLKISS